MFEKVGAILGAFTFLQFPQFYLQYVHELYGHISELKYQVNLFEQAAHFSGKTLTEWIIKFTQNEDYDIVLQGKLLQDMVERLKFLQQSATTLETSSFLGKPFEFIRWADQTIAYETWQNFEWGLSFSLEGMEYAGIGLILGYIVFKVLRLAFSNARRQKQKSQ